MIIQKLSKYALICLFMWAFWGCTSTKKRNQPIYDETKSGFINPNTFQLYGVAENVEYGYTSDFPIPVGGKIKEEDVLNQRRYLNAITGPKGEKVIYRQLESCCYQKKNINGEMKLTYLDRYEISYEGNPQHFVIFIDSFEKGEMLAPKGFSFKIEEKKQKKQ